MANQPNLPNNDITLGPQFQSIQHKASTHSEKVHQLDLKYHTGQVVKYIDGKGIPQYAIKTAPGQYIDLKTRKPLDIRQATGMLLKGSEVSFSQLRNELPNISKNMMSYREHMLTMDAETVIKHGQLTKPGEVFSIGLAGVYGKGENRKLLATEYYMLDVIDDVLKGSSEGKSSLKTMSNQVKKGYYKQFRKLAHQKAIDFTDIKNFNNLIQRKDVLRRLVAEINTTETKSFAYDDPTVEGSRIVNKLTQGLGTKKARVRRGLTYAKHYTSQVRNFMGVDFGEGTVFGSFNPGGVDEEVLKLVDQGRDHNTIDLRGHELFTNATLFPGMADNLHVTLGPTMDKVAHRLRMSVKEKGKFFQLFKEGMGSMYAKGTAAEDVEMSLAYSLGQTSKLNYKATHHTALRDTFREMNAFMMQDTFVDKAMREMVYPGIQFKSPRSRKIVAFMMNQAVGAMTEESSIFSNTPKDKAKLFGIIGRTINMKSVEKEVGAVLETSTSVRLEKDLLHSNLRQFGGSTISHLLAGSLMLAGVRVAVNKARQLFTETRENNYEGIRHESIPTIVRRMSLTDFGSGSLPFNPVSSIVAIGAQMFRNAIKNPKGVAGIVKRRLKNINTLIKQYKGKGSILAMYNNDKKMLALTKKVLGPNGHLVKMVGELRYRGYIGEKETAEKIIKTARSILGGTLLNRIYKPDGATKVTMRGMIQSLSNMFVTRGKDGQGMLKAPAVMIGAGAIGGMAIMLSRGKYDPEEMAKPIMSKNELQYKRTDNDRRKIRQTLMDINNTNNEGIAPGSKDRQRLRYSLTDFGSGWRGILRATSTSLDYGTRLIRRWSPQVLGSEIPPRVRTNTIRRMVDTWTKRVGVGKLKGAQRIRALREIVDEAREISRGAEQIVRHGYKLAGRKGISFKSVKEIAIELMSNDAPVVLSINKTAGRKVADAAVLRYTSKGAETQYVRLMAKLTRKKSPRSGKYYKHWQYSQVQPGQILTRDTATVNPKARLSTAEVSTGRIDRATKMPMLATGRSSQIERDISIRVAEESRKIKRPSRLRNIGWTPTRTTGRDLMNITEARGVTDYTQANSMRQQKPMRFKMPKGRAERTSGYTMPTNTGVKNVDVDEMELFGLHLPKRDRSGIKINALPHTTNRDTMEKITSRLPATTREMGVRNKALVNLHGKKMSGAPGGHSRVKKISDVSVGNSIDMGYRTLDDVPDVVTKGGATKHYEGSTLGISGIKRKIQVPESNVPSQTTTDYMYTVDKARYTKEYGKYPSLRSNRDEMLFRADSISRDIINSKGIGYDKVAHGSMGIPMMSLPDIPGPAGSYQFL